MGKTFARITKIVVALIILLIVAAIIASKVIDPNKYKSEITKIVSENTNRDFVISGDISWSVFPSIAINVQDTSLGNIKGFKGKLVTIENLSVKLKILPLLKKQVSIKGLRIDGLNLAIIRNKDGSTNIDDFINDDAMPNQSKLEDINKAYISNAKFDANKEIFQQVKLNSETEKFRLPKLNLGDIDISNSNVSWNDNLKKDSYTLSNIKIKTKGLDLAKNSKLPPIRLGTKLLSSKSEYPVNFSVKAILNPVKMHLKLDPLEIKISDMTTKISGEIKDPLGDLSLIGKLEIPKFSPVTAFNDKNLPEKFSLQSKLKYTNDKASLSSLKAIVDNGNCTGNVDADLGKINKVKFDLKAEDFNFDKLVQLIGAISTAGLDPDTLKKQNNRKSKSVEIIPIKIVQTLSLDGSLKATNTTLPNGIKVDSVDMMVRGDKGLINANPISIKLGDTVHNYEIKLDATTNTPIYEATGEAKHFEISKLVQAFGQDKVISGTAEYSIALIFRGNNINAIKRSLSGATKFKVTDGNIYGINVKETIDKTVNAAKDLYEIAKGSNKFNIAKVLASNTKKYNVAPKKDDITPFKQVSATSKIKAGVIYNNDLLVLSPDFKGTGSGAVSIPRNNIDYIAKVHLPQQEGAKDIEKLLREKPLEINITGPIEDPKIKPNLEGFVQIVIRGAQKSLIKSFTKKIIKRAIGGDVIEMIDNVTTAKDAKDTVTGNNSPKSEGKSNNPVNKLLDILN